MLRIYRACAIRDKILALPPDAWEPRLDGRTVWLDGAHVNHWAQDREGNRPAFDQLDHAARDLRSPFLNVFDIYVDELRHKAFSFDWTAGEPIQFRSMKRGGWEHRVFGLPKWVRRERKMTMFYTPVKITALMQRLIDDARTA